MNNENPDINITLTEILLRLTAIEKTLINKNIITEDELLKEVGLLSKSLIEALKNSKEN